MFISTIFGVGDGSTILPIRYCLGGQTFLSDIFLTQSQKCLMGVSDDSFETYSAHDWCFFWLNSRQVASVTFWKLIEFPLWILDFVGLSCPRLALLSGHRGILHQTKGFISWGWWLPLGCCHLRPWLCVRQECKGSTSSRMSSVTPSKHRSWNFSQSALESTQWEGSQLSCVSVVSLMVEPKSGWDNGRYHRYRAGPPPSRGWMRGRPVWAGDMGQLYLQTMWGHVGLRDRGSVGLSHRDGVVGISHSGGVDGTSHRCSVLDTN